MKLWQKDKDSLQEVTRFTVGQDREMDLLLASFDVMGSLAHIQMLKSIGLLTEAEEKVLGTELKSILKKIHSGRSRNDQVLVDIKLFLRQAIREIVADTKQLFDLLIQLSEKNKAHL